MGETATGFAAVRTRSLATRGGIAVVLSVVANVLIVAGAQALGIAPDFRALTVPPVAFLSALGAVGATAVYWVLDRYSDRPERTFRRVAIATLVVSFVPDLALLAIDEAATVTGVAVLMLMHAVVAIVAIELLVGREDGGR
jgi:hypothetical protein